MSESLNTVLFIDDDAVATKATAKSLERRGYGFDFLFATETTSALRILQDKAPEAIVLDLSLSSDSDPQEGIEFLETLQSADPSVRVLILTGHDAREYGVQCMKRGAASFLTKPIDAEHLGAILRDAVQATQLRRSYLQLSKTPESVQSLTGLSSRSPSMQATLQAVAYAASHNQPILIVGETGVGKGVLAQAIHRASARRARPFIRVQPRFGSSDLSASEIFGHERGAFTGAIESRKGLLEEAHGGTLFLDELDELPLETQILLLHALQEKTFRRLGSSRDIKSDFRLLAATNRPIEESLEKGKIREDFYHRLAHVTIEIPPLRNRIEDIPDLANECLRNLSNRENLKVQGIAPEALEKLLHYSWPGNVRELLAVIESSAFRAQFENRRFIEVSDLGLKKKAKSSNGTSFREQVQAFEIRLLEEALLRSGNNQTKAAEQLKMDRSSFRRLLGSRSKAGSSQ